MHIVCLSDYYTGGMMALDRYWNSDMYRFGFNGKASLLYGWKNDDIVRSF